MFERLTKTILAAVIPGLAVLCAADAPVDPKIATNITITGCLHGGEHSGDFVLVGVTEKTATGAVAAVPYAIYMLNSTNGMKDLVGELVDIKGVVVSKDAKHGTIKVVVDDDTAKTTDVTVERGSGNSTTTKEYAGKTNGPAAGSVIEVSRPVYRVNVESIIAAKTDQTGPACK